MELLLVLILIVLLGIESTIYHRGSKRWPIYTIVITPEEHERTRAQSARNTRALMITIAVVIAIVLAVYALRGA